MSVNYNYLQPHQVATLRDLHEHPGIDLLETICSDNKLYSKHREVREADCGLSSLLRFIETILKYNEKPKTDTVAISRDCAEASLHRAERSYYKYAGQDAWQQCKELEKALEENQADAK